MLILSRKVDEAIQIGPDVTVVVTAIYKLDGRRPVVKLGIKAPQHITVTRQEIADVVGDSEYEPKAAGARGSSGSRDCPRSQVIAASEGDAHVS